VITAALLLTLPQSLPPIEEGYTRANGPALNVNGELVTLFDVQRDMESALAVQPVTTPEEQEALLLQVLDRRIENLLRGQAGEDMGVDQGLIRGGVDRLLEQQVSLQGLLSRGRENQEEGRDRRAVESGVEERVHRINLLRSHLGYDAGARGRLWVDRFVRPGELFAAYQVNLERLGEPDQVQLLDLLLRWEQLGSLEAARGQVEAFREQVIAGEEDMEHLVQRHSYIREATTLLQLPLGGVAAELDPWLAGAQVGEVSPVTPARDAANLDQIAGYRFVQVVQRIPGEPPPPFFERGIQRYLRTTLEQLRDETLLEELDERLRATARLWSVFR
jgi:hypothetical protein